MFSGDVGVVDSLNGAIQAVFNVVLIGVHSFNPREDTRLPGFKSVDVDDLRGFLPVQLAEVFLVVNSEVAGGSSGDVGVFFHNEFSFDEAVGVVAFSGHDLDSEVVWFKADGLMATSFLAGVWGENFSDDLVVGAEVAFVVAGCVFPH